MRCFVSSYQSILFNQALQRLSRPPRELPVVGYLTNFKDDAVGRAYHHVLQQEGLRPADFLIRQLPEASSEGGMRPSFVTAKRFSCSWEADALHSGMLACTLSFFLRPGAYATWVVKALLLRGCLKPIVSFGNIRWQPSDHASLQHGEQEHDEDTSGERAKLYQ